MVNKCLIIKRLDSGLCPTINCKDGNNKTKLNEISPLHYNCSKCKGEWEFAISSPLDMGWLEIKKPIIKEE